MSLNCCYLWTGVIWLCCGVGGEDGSPDFRPAAASLAILHTQEPTPTPPPAQPDVLTVAQALASIGQAEIVVALTVQATKDRRDRRGALFLDSEADFQSPQNLGVALSVKVCDELQQRGIENPAEFFLNKSLRVTGSIMRFEERPYLPVLSIQQLKWEDSPKKEP